MIIYDHFLTFDLEVEMMWKERWTLPKLLWIVVWTASSPRMWPALICCSGPIPHPTHSDRSSMSRFFSNKYWRNSLQIMGSDSLLLNFCIHLKAIKNSRSIAQLDRLILSALDMVSHRRNGRRHPRCSHHPHASDLGFVWKMRVTLIIYSRACVLTVWLSPNSSMGHASSGLHPIRTTWSHARKSRIPTCCSWPCRSKLDT